MLVPIVEIFCDIDDFCKDWFKESCAYEKRATSYYSSTEEYEGKNNDLLWTVFPQSSGFGRNSYIDQLKTICHIEHSRHRNPDNFAINLVSGLAAYMFRPRKPSLKLHSKIEHSQLITSSWGLLLNGCIITLEAMGCQRAIVEKIISGKGDYVISLKGNQGILHNDVKRKHAGWFKEYLLSLWLYCLNFNAWALWGLLIIWVSRWSICY